MEEKETSRELGRLSPETEVDDESVEIRLMHRRLTRRWVTLESPYGAKLLIEDRSLDRVVESRGFLD
jgi:hypothetical protein